jgi:hypothetical protein
MPSAVEWEGLGRTLSGRRLKDYFGNREEYLRLDGQRLAFVIAAAAQRRVP